MKAAVIIISLLICASHQAMLWADAPATEADQPLFTEPDSSSSAESVPASPIEPWGEFTVTKGKKQYRWWEHALLWFPNRVMDLIDIFRVDVGVGPSVGAVVRISKYGQFGVRHMTPASVRIGDFGRKAPYLMERSSEFGIGPGFVESKDRKVCPGEIGLGADVVLVGAYAGFCTEELFDFFTGLFFIDLQDDDMK